MPVKDAFESIEHVMRFSDEFWTAKSRKRIRPNKKTVHVLLIGGGYHFKLCVLHRHASTTRVTYFDSMGVTPRVTEELIQDFCDGRRHTHFYMTECKWQQDAVHCGMYVCAAVHSILLQLCHAHTLGPNWTPVIFQKIHPLRLVSCANNAHYMQTRLRPAYAKLLRKHMTHLMHKMPSEVEDIAPPFRSSRAYTTQPSVDTNDTGVIDLSSD